MAEPTHKGKEVEKFLDSITPNPKGRRGSIEANECTWCLGPANEFRDDLSREEYRVSGFCQKCQDATFKAR